MSKCNIHWKQASLPIHLIFTVFYVVPIYLLHVIFFIILISVLNMLRLKYLSDSVPISDAGMDRGVAMEKRYSVIFSCALHNILWQ